ncbi:DNA-directed rna polymerase III 25 kd polypeptide [Kalaharituber pfeilii]|nr:DNA-directed rna polymerase III 25 kd polypeptide [Kalaharituber pfeilii]
MFILTTFSDLIVIKPQDFSKPTAEALEDEINAKYANKVVYNIGLCICLYDVLKVSEGLIGYGNGSANVHVQFRLIVFRPFKGEILSGRISSSTPAGIKVRLDFFEDILIPGHLLFDGCVFDIKENVWIWHNEGTELYMDKGEVIRFKVENEKFTDQTPVNPQTAVAKVDTPGGGETAAVELHKDPPYQINASCRDAGLGLVAWW